MSNLGEVEKAIVVLEEGGLSRDDMVVLHATTEYPCPMHEVNLLAMQTIARAFNVPVGYSDHTQGIEISLAAVALGAQVIEKHFTLDRTLPGPDHLASIEPKQLGDLVSAVRNIESALGDGIKRATVSEMSNIAAARKSIVASTVIKKGNLFSTENLTVKRPGGGLSPMMWDNLLGSKAQQDYQPDDVIELFLKK
jgi:N,N'-diacetyllegionaminate synthase